MSNFLDGPAAGVRLLLHRAPIMLRAVRKPGGEWDALDQLDDTAEANEQVVVYIAKGKVARVHLCRSPRKLSGFYEEREYVVLPEQPEDTAMRSGWSEWCETNQQRLVELHRQISNYSEPA